MKENCDCLKKVSELAVKHVTDTSTLKSFKVKDFRWKNSSIYPKQRIYSVIELNYTFERVDGNESKTKNDSISIFYTYCPFCGLKYENE